MQTSGWLQLALYVIALAVITKPMGLYLMQVLDANGKPGSIRCSAAGTVDVSRDGCGRPQRARLETIHALPCCFSVW